MQNNYQTCLMDQPRPHSEHNSQREDFDLEPKTIQDENLATPSPLFSSCYVTQRMNVNVFLAE